MSSSNRSPLSGRSRDTRRTHRSSPTRIAMGIALVLGVAAPAIGWTVQSTTPGMFDSKARADFVANVEARQRPLIVDLRSRPVLPQKGSPITFTNGRAELYLQFTRDLSSEERGRLIRAGVRFFEALPPSTYLVRVKESSLETLTVSPLVRGWEQVRPEDKLTEEVFTGNVRENARNLDGTLQMHVRFYEDVRLVEALAALDELGIFVHDRSRFLVNEKIEVAGKLEKLRLLARSNTVMSIEPVPRPGRDNNVTAAARSNVDDIQAPPYSLTGTGVIFGEWDGGNVRTDHPDLTGRVTLVENTSNSDHSTHVAGTIIGNGTNDAAARGMSTSATLFSWNYNGNAATEHDDGVTNQSIVITNNSWGRVIGWDDQGVDNGGDSDFGNYDGESADFDAVVRNRNLVICKSAGNDRNDCNPSDNTDCDGTLGADGVRYDVIPTWGISKNVITVGATNDTDGIAGFSSAGPADDGRIKPDIVANGVSVYSTWAGGVTLNNCGMGADYCSIQGTSMSTPVVAGTTGLLFERYRQVYGGIDPTPDIVKALLVNSALDLGRPGPDYLFGHGLLDALGAARLIDAGPVRIVTDAVANAGVDTWLIAVPAGQPDLRVTLCWLDPTGSTNSSNPDIVNNLNLELVSPANQVFFPFSCDGANPTNVATTTGPNNRDTVESAIITNPIQGFWRARVRGASVPIGPQNYALVANRAFQLPDQPNITVNAALDYDELCEGQFQDKIVSIFNTGGADLLVNSVVVNSGVGTFTVQPNPIQPFLVHAGAHVDVTVRFDPPGPGSFAGTLQIFSNDPDQMFYDIAMTGDGCPPPDIAISGSTDFGNVCSGELAEKVLNICNVGGDDLNVSSISFTSCDDFTIVNSPFPATVLPGHCLPLTVRYTPTESGAHTCTMVIASNDPDENPLNVAWTGNTPPVSIDVPDVGAFPPTVIQSVSDCVSVIPIQITNNGACPIYVKDVSIEPPGAHFSDFALVNRPALPITLLPGESLGDGAMEIHFRPNQVERFVTGTLKVKYQSDAPAVGDETTITRTVCGEGVKTGGRVLVRYNGVPLANVDRITLQRIDSFGPPMALTTLESVQNLAVQTVAPVPPCPGFQFHREWGGVTNPILLAPGNYLIEAKATINGVLRTQKLLFDVGLCDFEADLVIDM